MAKFRIEGVLREAERYFPEENLLKAGALLGGCRGHTYGGGHTAFCLEVEDSAAGDRGGLFDQLCALMRPGAELRLDYTDLFCYERGQVVLTAAKWYLGPDPWAEEEEE